MGWMADRYGASKYRDPEVTTAASAADVADAAASVAIASTVALSACSAEYSAVFGLLAQRRISSTVYFRSVIAVHPPLG